MVFRRRQRWFWCQEHERAEPSRDACPRDRRLGPYDSKEAAEQWRELHQQREETWQEQDEAWADQGTDDD